MVRTGTIWASVAGVSNRGLGRMIVKTSKSFAAVVVGQYYAYITRAFIISDVLIVLCI